MYLHVSHEKLVLKHSETAAATQQHASKAMPAQLQLQQA